MADSEFNQLVEDVHRYAQEVLDSYDEAVHDSNELLLARSAHILTSLIQGKVPEGSEVVGAIFAGIEARLFSRLLLALTEDFPKMPASEAMIDVGGNGRLFLLCVNEKYRDREYLRPDNGDE